MSEPIAPAAPSGRGGFVRRRAADGLAMAMALGAVFLLHFWERRSPSDSLWNEATARLIAAANKCSCVVLNAAGHDSDAEGRLLYLHDVGKDGLSVVVMDDGSPMSHALLLTAMLTMGSIVAARTWEVGRKRHVGIFLISLLLTIPLLVFFAGVFQAVGLLAAIRRGDFLPESMAGVAAFASLFATAVSVVVLWLLTKDVVRATPHVQFAPLPEGAILSRPPMLWAAMVAAGALLAMLLVRVSGLFVRAERWGGSYGFRMLIGAACVAASWTLLNLVLLRLRAAIKWVLPPLVGLLIVSDLALTASLVFVLAAVALHDERTAVVCGQEVDGETYERIRRRASRPLTPLAWILAVFALLGAAGGVLQRAAAIDFPYVRTVAHPAIAIPLALVGAAAALWERRDLRRLQAGGGTLAVAALLAVLAAVTIGALAVAA